MSLIVTSTSHDTSVLNGLLTPSRDVWEATLLGETLEILEVLDAPTEDKTAAAIAILALIERERTRCISEER